MDGSSGTSWRGAWRVPVAKRKARAVRHASAVTRELGSTGVELWMAGGMRLLRNRNAAGWDRRRGDSGNVERREVASQPQCRGGWDRGISDGVIPEGMRRPPCRRNARRVAVAY